MPLYSVRNCTQLYAQRFRVIKSNGYKVIIKRLIRERLQPDRTMKHARKLDHDCYSDIQPCAGAAYPYYSPIA